MVNKLISKTVRFLRMKTSSDHFIIMRDRISVFDQMQIETMTIILSAPLKLSSDQNTID